MIYARSASAGPIRGRGFDSRRLHALTASRSWGHSVSGMEAAGVSPASAAACFAIRASGVDLRAALRAVLGQLAGEPRGLAGARWPLASTPPPTAKMAAGGEPARTRRSRGTPRRVACRWRTRLPAIAKKTAHFDSPTDRKDGGGRRTRAGFARRRPIVHGDGSTPEPTWDAAGLRGAPARRRRRSPTVTLRASARLRRMDLAAARVPVLRQRNLPPTASPPAPAPGTPSPRARPSASSRSAGSRGSRRG